jgi:hypothetical protein
MTPLLHGVLPSGQHAIDSDYCSSCVFHVSTANGGAQAAWRAYISEETTLFWDILTSPKVAKRLALFKANLQRGKL